MLWGGGYGFLLLIADRLNSGLHQLIDEFPGVVISVATVQSDSQRMLVFLNTLVSVASRMIILILSATHFSLPER